MAFAPPMSVAGVEREVGAGLQRDVEPRFAPGDGEAWRPDWICHYFINDAAPGSFAIDVSAHYATKRQALACHRTR